jgi:fibronectin type 3 domain-containing protein
VNGAASYHVYVANEPGVTEDGAEIANIANTAYTHTYVDSALTYYYRVSAENPWAEGPLSSEVSATPLPPPPDEAPGSVAATPGDKQVVVTWATVAHVYGYRLHWDTTAGASGNVVDETESPYVHAGLANGTRYYYRISAYTAGGEGPHSVEVSAVPQVPAPGAPRNLRAVAGDGQVTLTWTEPDSPDGPDVSSYVVYWDTESPVNTNSAPIAEVHWSPYVHLGRANGTTYYYRVSAMNPGGESSLSLEVSATPQPLAPATPGYLQAQPDESGVMLSWGSVPRAEAYELFWDTQPGVTVADSFVDVATTDFLHKGLVIDTAHYYRVRARNAGGASSLSQEVSAVLHFQTCTLDGECASGFCREGYCCDSECAYKCKSCNGAVNQDGNGFCSNIGYGLTDDFPTELCIYQGGCATSSCACNGAGVCLGEDDSMFCSDGSQCLSGHCERTALIPRCVQ